MVDTLRKALIEAAKEFMNDDGLRLSSSLAFYAAFSLAPLILIAVSIAGMALGDDLVAGTLDESVQSTLGKSGAEVVQQMVAQARKQADSVLMSITGLTVLLVGAAGIFSQLQSALNTIWGVKESTNAKLIGFLKDRVLSFSMILVTGLLLLASTVLSTLIQAAAKYFGKTAGLSISVWSLVSSGVSFGLITLLFAATFKVLPDKIIRWRQVWTGALVTTIMFTIGKYAISWYLGRQATGSTYGSAASFAALLSWLYYSSIILFFGAEFTETHARISTNSGARPKASDTPPDKPNPGA